MDEWEKDAATREERLSDEVSHLRLFDELESVQTDLTLARAEVKAQKSSVKKKKHMVQKLEKDHDNWAKEAEDCHQKWESTEGEHLRPR